jgi:hypothetical protein
VRRRPRSGPGRPAHPILTLALAVPLALAVLAILPSGARADGGLTMTARALLGGHVRLGGWFGIAVDAANTGPAVTGELRILGGTDGRTRFSQPAELATGSRKQFLLFAQPNASTMDASPTVELVSDGKVLASAKLSISFTDTSTTTIGVLAGSPGKLVNQLGLLPSGGSTSAIVTLTAADLPERVQPWTMLDALVWQDVDASSLSTAQLAALRTWVASGGRLVIVGGTAGPAELSAIPDDLLPYRPTATLDIDPSVLNSVLGAVPSGGSTLPALAGTLAHGRALATSGDRTVAGDMAYGAGSVTLIGFDPTTSLLTQGDQSSTALWRRLLPTAPVSVPMIDDSTVVGVASSLPSSALPATGGLLALLIAYILLVGPANYVVLRVLDRREWAWVTVPVLIATFTVAAFGIGVAARGSDVVLHQVAIVSGSQGTDQATAQAWTTIFSPSRGSFQVRATGDTLLSAPISSAMMTGGSSSALDVLEGDPTRIRDMPVGYGSVQTLRSDGTTSGPVIDADLRLDGSVIKGTVTNRSTTALTDVAIVLGNSVAKLGGLGAGASAAVNLTLTTLDMNNFMMLSDRLFGQIWDSSGNAAARRVYERHSIIDQLTNNAAGITFQGAFGGGGVVSGGGFANGPIQMAMPMGNVTTFVSNSATLLAWGTDPVLALSVDGVQASQSADVLYQVPLRVAVRGPVRFFGDLLPGTVTSMTATGFSKDPTTLWMDTGTMTMSYRPMTFDGTLTPSKVTIAETSGGVTSMPPGTPSNAPVGSRCTPGTAGCLTSSSLVPDVDVYDVRAAQWVELGSLAVSAPYTLPDPGRWVDPRTGEVQVRFQNQGHGQLGFQFLIAVEGSVQ